MPPKAAAKPGKATSKPRSGTAKGKEPARETTKSRRQQPDSDVGSGSDQQDEDGFDDDDDPFAEEDDETPAIIKKRSGQNKRQRAEANDDVDAEEDRDDDDDDEEDAPQTIPPELLTRIMHEFFEKDGTRISKDANTATAKYMDIFVRETIARAAVEKEGGFVEVSLSRESRLYLLQSFLMTDCRVQVEDLEKIAPQVLLDL